jgi:hypothetical protein
MVLGLCFHEAFLRFPFWLPPNWEALSPVGEEFSIAESGYFVTQVAIVQM